MKPTLGVIVIACGLVVSGVALAYNIRGSVVGNGGVSATTLGGGSSNGTYRIYGTAGQAGVGFSQNTSFKLCSGFWCFGGSRVVAVDPRGPSLPTEFALGSAIPNPTRGQAQFHLALPTPAMVALAVYDVGGRQVGDELTRAFPAGEHELFWQAGPDAKTGIYFMTLKTNGVVKAKRMLVLVR